MRLASRMESIPFSGIRKIFEEVSRREQTGENIIHLEIGRPNFDTPNNIKSQARQALEEGKVHYTSNYGIPELRQAVANKLLQDNGLSYDPEQEIIITVGASEAVFLSMMALLNPGDEVLIPDPCWPHYYNCVRLAGAKPISIPLRQENGFDPDPNDFISRLTKNTRMVIVNTPHNPTGAVFTQKAIRDLADLAQEHDFFVLSDEIYEKLIYEDAEHKSIGALPHMKQRTITINGFSKIFSMTGWRLGYVAAPPELIGAMIRIHQNIAVCATTFVQWGGVEALNGPADEYKRMVDEFDRRRKMVCQCLTDMRGVKLVEPKGAFYVFPNIEELGVSSEKLTWYLLDQAKIAVVPGTTLGDHAEGYIRISYANSYENLQKAMDRMSEALNRING